MRTGEAEIASKLAATLSAVLDEHAELSEILALLQEAPDLQLLGGLLVRLEAHLETHFGREEESGLLELLGADSVPDALEDLVAEHREILNRVRVLAPRINGAEAPDEVKVRREAAAILRMLRDHDAREAALLREWVGLEAGEPIDAAPLQSEALVANLRRTAVSVVIPEEQRVLLECTAHLQGVHENTKALLREINHPFAGWSETIEDLHRRATSDFPHYLTHKRAPAAVGVFCQLYENSIAAAAPGALRETALRRYLQYLAKVSAEAGPRWTDLRAPVERALARLGCTFAKSPALAARATPGLRRVAEALRAVDPEGDATLRCLERTAGALRQLYDGWLEREDPARWWRELSEAAPTEPTPELVAIIAHAGLEAQLEKLDKLSKSAKLGETEARALLALPDEARIERGYVEAAASVESPNCAPWQNRLRRIRWLIRVLSEDALRAVHDDAITEIHCANLHALREADADCAVPVVREIFAALRRSHPTSSLAALTLIARLGQEALTARDSAWADAFVGQLLDWDFAYPRFSGFTEEWRVRSHPAHVESIRTFLRVIEANPKAAVPLVAALVVHLKLGGALVADTDVFQRDVSRLLASPIAPIYHPLKHLLKLFPVYFTEIGAEGKLRDFSSRIDEIGGRRDPLCHFLRKQYHVEGTPELVGLTEAVGYFWTTGDREPLRGYLPTSLYDDLDIDDPRHRGLHQLFQRLAGEEPPERLFALGPESFEKKLAMLTSGSEIDREKARLLIQLHHLVSIKYETRHDDVIERLEACHSVPDDRVEALRAALAVEDDESALGHLLDILEELKAIVMREGAGEVHEEIYYKRHIAAGIPSMYGSYREEKIEAVGLSLRVESLGNALFDRLVSNASLRWVTGSAMHRVMTWLHLLRRALWIDGCRARGLSAAIAMLEQALAAGDANVAQYANIFQVLSRGIEQLVRIRFLDVYEDVLDRILPRALENGVVRAKGRSDPEEAQFQLSEAFLRDLIASGFGLPQLDRLVGRVLRSLVRARDALEPPTAELLIGYRPERGCVEIDGTPGPFDGAVHLGNKGYLLEKMAGYGLPIPNGFILTTEIFRHRPVLEACPELARDLDGHLRNQLARLERLTALRFGDPRHTLLLSVRSSAAMSMPGMLDTFLNVGINPEIAEGFARHSGSPWAAWDVYRRFLQLYGMAFGLERDLFDALIHEVKHRHGAAKKAHLTADTMRDLALRYRDLVRDHGIAIEEDPFTQLRTCVDLVMRSWDAEKARVYREETQIADTWGTAVVIQSMVYGNLSPRSGTGVVRTLDTRCRARDVHLAGDFVVQGQGDDVVSGLVETFPIEADERPAAMSLERDFPSIYAALLRFARHLVLDREMFPQEMEFTFESDDPADLHVLQTRDSVMATITSASAFIPGEHLERAKVATGIGAGGGALSGRVAHGACDVEELRRRFPNDPIILLRSDTVPDDVPLVLRCDAMVTALGGATSHAALVAQRLGRTCVVGCRQLEVREEASCSVFDGHRVVTGDFLSINGIDGSVYLGQHPTTTVRRQRFG